MKNNKENQTKTTTTKKTRERQREMSNAQDPECQVEQTIKFESLISLRGSQVRKLDFL